MDRTESPIEDQERDVTEESAVTEYKKEDEKLYFTIFMTVMKNITNYADAENIVSSKMHVPNPCFCRNITTLFKNFSFEKKPADTTK